MLIEISVLTLMKQINIIRDNSIGKGSFVVGLVRSIRL